MRTDSIDVAEESVVTLDRALRQHFGFKKEYEYPWDIKWLVRNYQTDKRYAKLTNTQQVRLLLCELAYEYKQQKKFTPAVLDSILNYIYNPSEQCAYEALRQSPRAYLFVGHVLGDTALKKVLSKGVDRRYLKKMLSDKTLQGQELDMIGIYGNADVKRLAFSLELKK